MICLYTLPSHILIHSKTQSTDGQSLTFMYHNFQASQVALVIKNLPAKSGDIRDMGLISGLGRSPGGVHGNPLQYSCLENPMDRRTWEATVHRISESHEATSCTQVTWHLSDFSFPATKAPIP